MKLILAASARKNDAGNSGWADGALQYGSGTQRYHFNHEYGFGVVDADAAVDLAADWTLLPELIKTASVSDDPDPDLMIPDPVTNRPVPVTRSITLDSTVEFIEFVEINATFTHPRFRDLEVELESPSGAKSVLTEAYFLSPSTDSATHFRFGSAKHLGENPAGTWKLHIRDRGSTETGTLESWSLTVYGHQSSPGAPNINSVTPGSGSLTVTWEEPTNTGASDIITYDVRYIKTVDDETDDDNWTVEEDVWTSTTGGALEYTISGLDPNVEYDIQVRAINANGSGPWSAPTAATPGNEAPTLTGPTSVPYDENGTGPVATYSATDPEGATIAWSLSGANSDAFSGDAGVLTFNSPPDYEAPADDGRNNGYQVTMRASDGTNTTTRAVTVTVTNVDEAGSVPLSSVQPQVGTPFVATLTDPDGQISATTWVWERSSDETT